jgi:predicted SAM-dependent methyltransferase
MPFGKDTVSHGTAQLAISTETLWSLSVQRLRSIARRHAHELRAPRRWAKRLITDRFTVSRYLATHAVRKLQVGVGYNPHDGWLNGDIEPIAQRAIYLDARRRVPLPDRSFDYVFSEHMIEHIDYASGRTMLEECFRILKPGGRIRICTPDLAKILHLLSPDRSPIESDYIEWATREHVPASDRADAVFVVNNYVRDWGHQFIYDTDVLTRTLTQAGFIDVVPHALGESGDAHLRGLENVGRMPPGFLDIESMVLEAAKP